LKVLFITNATNKYGASRSLGLLIEGLLKEKYLGKEDIFLIYQRYFRKSKSKLELKIYRDLKNKNRWILPASVIYVGHPASRFLRFMRFVHGLLFFFFYLFKYSSQLHRMNVDVIHINSITLWFLLLYLPKNIPIIMHVREELELRKNTYEAYWAKKMISRRSDAIIAIDDSVGKVFDSINKYVLKNPYSMERARILRINNQSELKKKYKVPSNKIIVSIIGEITEYKGTSFFIDSARQMKEDERFLFFIIGSKDTRYSRSLLSQAGNLDNIIVIPETLQIEELYALTDVVVRCDEGSSLGRTVWEGLYSGCKVLIPFVENRDLSTLSQYIEKELFFYESRDRNSFKEALYRINKTGCDSSIPETGNLGEYARKYWEIIQTIKLKE